MNKIIKISLVGILLILTACGEVTPSGPGKYANAAKCLTQKGVIMYGAFWCPHCANQKNRFGDDFQFIKYQECDDKGKGGNHQLCLENGVSSYPTWFFPGQGNLPGEMEVRQLAKVANCVDTLPQEDQDLLKTEASAAASTDTATTKESSGTSEPATTK